MPGKLSTAEKQALSTEIIFYMKSEKALFDSYRVITATSWRKRLFLKKKDFYRLGCGIRLVALPGETLIEGAGESFPKVPGFKIRIALIQGSVIP